MVSSSCLSDEGDGHFVGAAGDSVGDFDGNLVVGAKVGLVGFDDGALVGPVGFDDGALVGPVGDIEGVLLAPSPPSPLSPSSLLPL